MTCLAMLASLFACSTQIIYRETLVIYKIYQVVEYTNENLDSSRVHTKIFKMEARLLDKNGYLQSK